MNRILIVAILAGAMLIMPLAGCITTTAPDGTTTTQIDFAQAREALAFAIEAYNVLVETGVISRDEPDEQQAERVDQILDIILARYASGDGVVLLDVVREYLDSIGVALPPETAAAL